MPVEFVYSTAHNKESEAVVTFLGTTGWMAGSDFDLTPVSELNIVSSHSSCPFLPCNMMRLSYRHP